MSTGGAPAPGESGAMTAECSELADSADAAGAWPAAFELLFEHAAMGVALIAPDGRVLRANPMLCDMLGYEESELRRFGLQGIVHDEDVASERESRLALVADPQAIERREL